MRVSHGRPVTILLDTRRRHWDQNPFISLLADGLSPSVEVAGFSWRTAILGRYDVVHVHWPEYLVHRKGRVSSAALKILFLLWILRLKMSNTPVVKTMHNVTPHDAHSRVSSFLLRTLENRYVARIWLTTPPIQKTSKTPCIDVCIPHGDYVPWLNGLGIDDEVIRRAAMARNDSPTTRFLSFGLIKRYKSLEEPIRAVVGSQRPQLRLIIAGKAPDRSYFDELVTLANSDQRIDLQNRRLPDMELVNEILGSDFVVLPYRKLYNSGALMLALSLGRPVVLRRSPISELLLEEYGENWVYLYEGAFSSEVLHSLDSLVRVAEQSRKLSPARSWDRLSEDHTNVYQSVLNADLSKRLFSVES